MLEIPQHGSGSPPYEVHGAGPRRAAQETYSRIIGWIEKYLLLLVLGGLIAGIGVASVSQPVVDRVDSAINVFMNLYDLVAPAAIFLILTPALARVFSTRTMGRFGVLVIRWYAVRKVLACLWAILFILIVFRIPFLPQGSLSVSDGILQTLQSLGRMAGDQHLLLGHVRGYRALPGFDPRKSGNSCPREDDGRSGAGGKLSHADHSPVHV